MYGVELTKKAMQVLKPALPFAKGTIKAEISQGISQLYMTDLGNLYVVARPEGAELVIVAVAGFNLLHSQQEILQFAKSQGFQSIRFHTRYPEHLKKGLGGLRYTLVEIRQRVFGNNEHVFKVNI